MKLHLFLIFLLVVASNCADQMKHMEIDIQGHRGARGLMPENTIPAFIHALELGVHTLEMDLAVTSEGQIVVSHEPWMHQDICLDPYGREFSAAEAMSYNIHQMTYEEVKQFDCGQKVHPDFPRQHKLNATKPLLREVIEVCEAYWKNTFRNPPHYNLEIKRRTGYDGIYHPSAEEFVELTIGLLQNKEVHERSCIQSFDLETLHYLNRTYPKQTLAYLVAREHNVRKNLAKLDFKPDIYSPDYRLLDELAVEYLHSQQIRVIPWTVNKIDDMRHMMNIGVDGIITDFPDRLIALVDDLRSLGVPADMD